MFGMPARYRNRFRFNHGTRVGVGRYSNFNARIEDVVRSLKKISIAAALAAVLFVGTSSIPLAQQTDDVNELNKRVLELYRAGRYSDAIQIAQRVLAIFKKALGRDHPDVAQSLNNLAELYRFQGRYADAEPLYRRSLAIYVQPSPGADADRLSRCTSRAEHNPQVRMIARPLRPFRLKPNER
jgi:tetratricopeptide (TPR) repeat protein